MIRRFKNSFLLISIIFQTNQVLLFSQPNNYIDGKIINSASSDPVPFATVKLKKNQLGVYANADGDFRIIRNPEFQADSLIITCIGFKRSSIAFKDLIEIKVNKIYVSPAIYGLGEVKVQASRKKLNSFEIIAKAIRKIKSNYPVNPYSYIGYYRDYQKKDKNYLNLNEAIVQTLDNGFAMESISNKYRILDFRKNIDFPRMDISPYYDTFNPEEINFPDKIIPKATIGDQYGNELFILMVHDPLRNFRTNSFSFINTFSRDFLYNHNFSEPARVFNNNLLLYKIIFNGKSKIIGDSLLVSGAIYIQPKDYSIHKLEYSCFYLLEGKRLKNMFNVDIEYGYESSVDSLMCLKYISFNNIFDVVDAADSTYFRVTGSYFDSGDRSNSTIVIEFNNTIDLLTALNKDNYEILVENKKTKILNIEVEGRELIIKIKTEKTEIRIAIRNIKDMNGNVLNKRKLLELYQYRELFVQEYNKSLPFIDSCYIRYMPLEQNCISKYAGNYNYWMNTPENIKVDK
jgi:hypothetical protein